MDDVPARSVRFDTTVPSAARIYDYLLGGKDNYAVDRLAADRLLAVVPDQRQLARANRAFALRAVRLLAMQGVRQVIDLGTGIPTSPSLHEVLHAVHPAGRVVYVDRDPMVKTHNDVLLATTGSGPGSRSSSPGSRCCRRAWSTWNAGGRSGRPRRPG